MAKHFFLALPTELLRQIVEYLPDEALLNLLYVCWLLRELALMELPYLLSYLCVGCFNYAKPIRKFEMMMLGRRPWL